MPSTLTSRLTKSLPLPAAVVATQMVSVREAVEFTRPCQLRHLWHSLWSRTPRASFRQTPEYLEASQSSRDDRWRFLIVSAWQRPIGIVPLRERTVRRAFRSLRVLSMADCPGPVGPHPAMTLAAAVRYLEEQDDSWDMLEFPEVVATGDEPTCLPRALNSHRITFQSSPGALLGLELPATFGQFWADRDAAARQRWRDLEARRSRYRDEQFIRFRPGGAFHGDTDREWELLDQLKVIVRAQDGTPHAARSRELFDRLRDMHAPAVDAASADAVLWLQGSKPAAFAYNFHCQSRVETALLLADPTIPHATDRLIGMMLQDEIARGDSWHLFLPSSVLGTTVNRRLWRPTELHKTTVTHDRRTTIRSRLQQWLGHDPRGVRQNFLASVVRS